MPQDFNYHKKHSSSVKTHGLVSTYLVLESAGRHRVGLEGPEMQPTQARVALAIRPLMQQVML
ncbi:MAG: hypothetical protein JWR62_2275 [Modestobacter sp.]|jgi:hypothetical protein|nr:hypothetical protein [Modestobacter sp.]